MSDYLKRKRELGGPMFMLSNYFAAGSITDATEKAAATTFIVGLFYAGILSKLDRLWLMSPTSQAAGLLDFITLTSMTNNFATHGSTGFTFNGTTAWLDTNYQPASSVKLSADDCSFGVNVYSGNPASTKSIIGCTDGNVPNSIRINSAVSGANLAWTYSAPSSGEQATYTAQTSTDMIGFRAVSRTSNTLINAYQNGCASLGNSTTANTGALCAANLGIGAFYNGLLGSAGLFFNGVINLGFVGRGLSTSEIQTFDELQSAYQNSLGRYAYAPTAATYFTNQSITNFTEKYAANRFIAEMEARNMWAKMSRVYMFSQTSATAGRACAKTNNLALIVNGASWSSAGYTTNGVTDLLKVDAATSTFTEMTTTSAHMFSMFSDPAFAPTQVYAGNDNGTDAFTLEGDLAI